MRKIHIVGLFVLFIYIGGVVLFSQIFYPNTIVNNENISFSSEKNVVQEQKKKIEEHSIILRSNQWDYDKKIYNSEYHYLNASNLNEYKNLIKEQKSFLWPIKIWNKRVVKIETSYPNEKSILKIAKFLMKENPKKKKEPKNASLLYNEETKSYDIIPEKYGNQLKKGKIKNTILNNLKKHSYIIDLSTCYKAPTIFSNSEKIIKAKEKMDKYLSAEISLKAGEKKVTLNGDNIHYFLCWDKNFEFWINRASVSDYVIENISSTFNTVGKSRTIHTKSKGKTTVSGGTYGWIIDVEKETDKLIKEIKNGTKTERKPIFSQKAASYSENDIGKTFIEISISDQHVWYVKNGNTITDADCVTGNVSTGHQTPTGVYFIEYKTTDYTMRKYNAHVDYWMPFDTGTGVGLHDADWRSSFGGTIYKKNGSHGCVNLPPWFAKEIYSVPVNTPVIVIN